MIDFLENIDRKLFIYLNGFHSEFLDQLMWFVSGKYEWIPLYALLLFLVVKKYRKYSWIFILFTVLSVVLADQISVKLFKEMFERWRPCHNLELKSIVHIVNEKCGGRFGFVSSHATNSFAVATFLGMAMNRKILVALLFWALVVSYSRIYLGVHYPFDILGGAILGVLIALITFSGATYFYKKMKP